jgi:3-methyladenine DNA glycosylase AlkC
LTTEARRGAVRKVFVTPVLRARIESGELETATHIEQMAVSMSALMAAIEPTLQEPARSLDGLPFLSRMRAGGALLHTLHGSSVYSSGPRLGYPDIARGWQVLAIQCDALSVEDAYAFAAPFADDPHFAVREWAWLAVRPWVVAEPPAALSMALALAKVGSNRVRRFSIESTRPRSVWGTHIKALKTRPDLAVPLLDEVAQDRDRYVLKSTANWIRDAAHTRPDWASSYAVQLADRPGLDPWFRAQLERVAQAALNGIQRDLSSRATRSVPRSRARR